MDKKLKISLDIDDRSFVSAVKRMQDELTKLNNPANLLQQQRQIDQKMRSMGLGGLPGAPSAGQVQQEQNKAKQQSDRVFQETKIKLENLKKIQMDLNKEMASGAASEAQKLKIQERLNDLKKEEYRVTGELTTQVERQNAKMQSQNKQFGTKLGMAAGAIGGVGAWIGGQGRLPIEAASAAGSAVTSLVGQQLREMTDPGHQAFLPERGKAIEAAKKAWQAGRIEDKMLNAASTLTAAVGIAALAGLDALTLGTATVPLAAAGAGLAGMFGTSKQRAITGGNQGAYEQLSAKDLAELTQQSITAQEQLNPLKKLAADYNAQNFQRNLGIQRGLGLSDQGFMGRGGFLQGNMAPGGRMQFTEDQVTQQQQAIMAAGGSARMGRQAGFGLELQKNLNLTNAPQMLGAISRTMGGAQETKQASIGVISEGFKQGLNDSDLIDLLRTFTQTTSEIIARSGARSQADVDRITSQFGKGVTDKTGVGMEAAKTGYEAYQRLSGATGGPMSVMQRAAMLSNPVLRRLAGGGEAGAMTFEKLKQIPQDQLTEDHPAVQSAVYLYNKSLKPGETPITAAQLISAQTATTGAGASISGSFGKSKSIVEQWRTKNPGADITKAPPDIQQAARIMQLAATTQGIGSAPELTRGQDIKAYGAQFLKAGPEQYGPSEALKETSKMADQVNANIASGQQAFIENFEKFKDAIVPAASNIDDLTKKLILLGQVAADVAAGRNTDKGALGKAAATLGTQPQADTSSSRRGSTGSY